MTTGIRRTVKFAWVYLHADDWPRSVVRVGDRLVPKRIDVELPGADGQPRLEMTIEVINGAPRCTMLKMERNDEGLEIRQRDLRQISLEEWVESFVALMAAEVVESDDGSISAIYDGSPEQAKDGMRAIRDARKGSRRPMTDERKKRVAETYNAQSIGGLEAVEAAFGVSRATAARYVRQAREAGLIPEAT